MKSKLLHEYSMTEYLYTNPGLLEEDWKKDAEEFVYQGFDKADDLFDWVEQRMPDVWIPQDRKDAKLIEKENDGIINRLRKSNTIWGDILMGAEWAPEDSIIQSDRGFRKDRDFVDIFEKRGVSPESPLYHQILTMAIALKTMETRNWGEVRQTITDWIRDFGGAGDEDASRAVGLGTAAVGIGLSAIGTVTGAAWIPLVGLGLTGLGLMGAAASFAKGEEDDILDYIRNQLGDEKLANQLTKGSGKQSGTAIQAIYWNYENYFLKAIEGADIHSDLVAVLPFNKWYHRKIKQQAEENLKDIDVEDAKREEFEKKRGKGTW